MSTMRDVDAFAEHVDGEHGSELSDFEPAQRRGALALGRLARQGDRSSPAAVKRSAMYSACSIETQKPSARIRPGSAMTRRIASSSLATRASSPVITRSSSSRRVAAALPAQAGEVGAVGDAEVLKRNQEPLVDRLPQPQLDRDATVEELGHVLRIHPLRRRRQAEQLLGIKAVEQPPIARRGRVVKLVDDHDVEVLRAKPVDVLLGDRLDHREHVPAGRRRGRRRGSPRTNRRGVRRERSRGSARGSARGGRRTAARGREPARWRSCR